MIRPPVAVVFATSQKIVLMPTITLSRIMNNDKQDNEQGQEIAKMRRQVCQWQWYLIRQELLEPILVPFIKDPFLTKEPCALLPSHNRPFSYSEKESQSNDTLLHFVEFSNVHNCERSSNATRSNLAYKNV